MSAGAGLAKTNYFLLSTATVMIGAMDELHDLNPTEHGIGLVKNFTMSSEPAYTELQQGVKGSVVFSVMTANPVKATMEVFEYTGKNLSYALGLDGAALEDTLGASTVGTAVPASPGQNTLLVVSGSTFSAGDTIMIQKDAVDDFVIRKIVSISTNTLTLDADLPAIGVGAKVKQVNVIDIGSKVDQPFFSAKIAGTLANGEAAVIEIPKLRITKGFNMAFTSDNYGNLPYEFTVYDLVSTDTSYAEFGNGNASSRIFL